MANRSDVTPMRSRRMLPSVLRQEEESESAVNPARRGGAAVYRVPTTDITVVE